MKNFVFISDFDGTLTTKDFYKIMMDKYLTSQQRDALYYDWRVKGMKTIDFLNRALASARLSEAELLEEIKTIPFDPTVPAFVERVRQAGGDFLILTAGCRYYIEKLLPFYDLTEVEIISMPGIYDQAQEVLRIIPDPQSPFAGDEYGIDKGKVVASYQQKYAKVYFAGDSGPDLPAALAADETFAREGLVKLLQEEGHPYREFGTFAEIGQWLFTESYFN